MKTIIVQETDKDILDMLTVALEYEGFKVYSVLGYDSNFLELIDQIRPHVVILDYRLNGQESIEVCHHIKSKYPHLPIVALSCNYNIHHEYDKFGFDDYIKKPFDLDILYSILRKHIPKHSPKAVVKNKANPLP
ncbi:MAG: response regulator receiver [Mucilaginibacter sp.]|jgi:DNA-binding response OmpR family regulator|nr:response regulator receiver [Mucilaginibacter sp.]